MAQLVVRNSEQKLVRRPRTLAARDGVSMEERQSFQICASRRVGGLSLASLWLAPVIISILELFNREANSDKPLVQRTKHRFSRKSAGAIRSQQATRPLRLYHNLTGDVMTKSRLTKLQISACFAHADIHLCSSLRPRVIAAKSNINALAAFGLVLGAMMVPCRAQIVIPTVAVGDVGNPNDSTGYGGVPYTYAIGATEVNLNQYTAFLNAVAATDTYDLYSASMGLDSNIAGISRSGSSGSYSYSVIGSGLHPVTYVSWFDAARFANWVANGQPTGAQENTTTENGAYTLLGATSGVSFTKNAINPNTSAATTFWIPSENEWYKAAYYDPGAGGPVDDYWLYPTRSDSAPGNSVGAGTNQANYFASGFAVTQSSNYSASQNYLTQGGAFSNSGSYYGTFDQGGNVWEWNDAVIGSFRGLRGGSWFDDAISMQSTNRVGELPTSEYSLVGFRVASVPEPSTSLLILMGGGAWMLARRWRAH